MTPVVSFRCVSLRSVSGLAVQARGGWGEGQAEPPLARANQDQRVAAAERAPITTA